MSVYLKATGTLADPAVAAQVGQGTVLGIQTLKIEAMGGLIAGLVAAKVADKFYRLELPLAFAFFGGKKSIPIITFACMIPIGLVVPIIWNALTSFLISISFIFTTPYIGSAIYYALNRALIPFGLHHVLASLVRFTEAGGTYMINGQEFVGILNATNEILFNLGPDSEYWSQLMPTLTSYLGGAQMLTTLFRVPAIGLAMYHTAYAKNKKIAKGVILTCCLTAFLGNITEPLEFSFLFISPALFVLYCVMCGIGLLPYQLFHICIGYIRGTIFDFGIFGLLYEHTQWIYLVLLGAVNFVVFYFVFKWFIVKFGLETPGREEFEVEESASQLLKEKNWPAIAALVVEGLGGKENIVNVENCISRLRVDLKDPKKVDQVKIKLSPVESEVRGKRVVMVDDSIVRGTTSGRIVQLLRDAGAKEIHMRISAPPFLHPCYYGTDIDSREHLIACHHTVEEIAEIIGVDSLGYLPLGNLRDLCGSEEYCSACFDGDYPTSIPEDTRKDQFEQKLSQRKAGEKP